MRLQIKWVNGWAQVHGTGPDGKRVRRALKTQDHGKAEEARAHLEARLWKSHHYGAETVVTFEEAALAYVNDGGEARFLPKIAEKLQGEVLRDITPKMIRDAARKAYPMAKNATINRQGIVPARAVMNYAHAQGWCPPIRVDGFPVDPPRKVAVDQAYLDALRPHLPARTYALLIFLHYTGRRIGDAISLTPDRISGAKVFFPVTKNGEPAVAVMPPAVAEIVAGIEPRHGRVFGYLERSSVYATLRRACEKAGVPYLGTHQPGRHSFATNLDGAGFSPKQIAEAGGWKSSALVEKTYIHSAGPQEKAARALGKLLASGKKYAKIPSSKSKVK